MRHISWALALLLLALPASAQVGPNIDELAKELANPGAANATLNFKFEYRTFDGELPGADDQDSFTATFQPVFPFVLSNGNNLIFRLHGFLACHAAGGFRRGIGSACLGRCLGTGC